MDDISMTLHVRMVFNDDGHWVPLEDQPVYDEL